MDERAKTVLIFGATIILVILGDLALASLFNGFNSASQPLALAIGAWTFTCFCFSTFFYIMEVPLGFLKNAKENGKA